MGELFFYSNRFRHAGLCTVGHAWLLVVWNPPPLENKPSSFHVRTHFLQVRKRLASGPRRTPDDPQITPATQWCISLPESLGWLTNAGYSHMLLPLFLIHYTAHMSRFASSCSLNKQKRHSAAVAKSLWTKLLPLTRHGFNYMLGNIKQVGQFVVGNHISIEGAQDITNDL